MVNPNRLKEKFEEFVRIDSVSRHENKFALYLAKMLEDMGGKVIFDNAGKACNSDSNNLFAKFNGNIDQEPLLLCGHMDTVEPGNNINPVFKDGIFTSDGSTILGSDDKSALAIIFEVLSVLAEDNLSHPPIEILFTICEEVGLLGAKNFDLSSMDSKFGYILDTGDINTIVTKAPASNSLKIRVFGKAAHAGSEPENGISAIAIASKAISMLQLGRIDHETTCNLGIIKGGVATNIIPEFLEIDGEVRSHDEDKLEKVTNTIRDAFKKARKEFCNEIKLPEIEFIADNDFPRTNIPGDSNVVILAKKAAGNLGRNLQEKIGGGGADANIFFQKGFMPGVLGTGMTDVHTVKEWISLDDMVKTAELVLEIIRIHSAK